LAAAAQSDFNIAGVNNAINSGQSLVSVGALPFVVGAGAAVAGGGFTAAGSSVLATATTIVLSPFVVTGATLTLGAGVGLGLGTLIDRYTDLSTIISTAVVGPVYTNPIPLKVDARSKPPGPNKDAKGRPHSVLTPDGGYITYNPDGSWKQYRPTGKDHGGIPRPNVKETEILTAPDGRTFISNPNVRPPQPGEKPGGG
jgi:hypothetical protein